MTKRFLLLLVCLVLAACGGGGGGGDIPAERPTHIADGYGVDAVICNGTVIAYSWSGGAKGTQLGQGTTDEYGYYNLKIKAPNQPVLLEIQGGYYTEEASDRRVTLQAGQKLYAVTYYSGEDLTIMITPWTTIAAGLAEYYVNVQNINAENAITAATSAITGIVGVNVLETYPINITDQANSTGNLTDGHLYGFFSASISSWTAQISEYNGLNPHTVYNSISLAQLMYADIQLDGALNGYGILFNGHAGNLFMGNYALNAGNYRQMIGHHLIQAAGADYNHTGLVVADLIEPAHQYSQRVNAIFDNEPPLPLDADGPEIFQTEPLGQYYAGTVTYPFRIVDPVGIESLSVSLDGDPLNVDVPDGTDETVSVTIRTTTYDDGAHTLTIAAADKIGNESTTELTFNINNTGILLNLTCATLTRTNPYTLTGTYEETAGGELENLTINGQAVAVNTNNKTWSYITNLGHGYNDIDLVGEDNLGNTSTLRFEIVLDQIQPAAETAHTDARFIRPDSSTFDRWLEDQNLTYPILFNYYNIFLNEVAVERNALDSARIPYFAFTPSDPPDNGAFTWPEDLVVTMTYNLNDVELSSRILYPVQDANEYLIPIVVEYMHTDFATCNDDDIHTFIVHIEDQAGNVLEKIFSFKAHVNTPQLNLSSSTRNSTVNVYAWDEAAKGGLVATGTTDQHGQANLGLLSNERPLLIEIAGGQYIETGSGYTVNFQESQVLQAVVDFVEEDITASVTPLTHATTAYAQYLARNGQAATDAINNANARVSEIYSINTLTTPLLDITDANNATEFVSDEYRHSFILAGLSRWTYDAAHANNASNQQQYNSLLLAELLARDLGNDGRFNGVEYFGEVPVNQDVYTKRFAEAIMAVIASNRNATTLDAVDFLNIDLDVTPTSNEALEFGNTTFADRSNLVSHEIYSTDYDFQNFNDHRLLLSYTSPSAHSLTHDYFDAVKYHTVRETRNFNYRARAYRYPTADTEWDSCGNDGCKLETNLGGWANVTSYQYFVMGYNPLIPSIPSTAGEYGTWQTRELPATEQILFDHNADQLPPATASGWEYFISGRVDNLLDLNVGRNETQRVYAPWVANYRISASGSYQFAWQANMNYVLGPGTVIMFLTQAAIDEIYSKYGKPPEIQRQTSIAYETIERYTDRTDHSASQQFGNNRFALEDWQGDPASMSYGYYVIPGQRHAKLKHYITLPNVTLFSSGNPTYTAATYDQALSWTLNKNVSLVVILGGLDMDQISQMPHYKLTTSGQNTYTVSR